MENQLDVVKTIVPNQEVRKLIPQVEDKILVDYVNTLSVAKDLQKTSTKRNGFLARLADGISGEGKERQDNINQHLINAWENSESLIMDLQQNISSHGVALIKINNTLAKTQDNLIHIGSTVLEVRKEMREMLGDLSSQIKKLNVMVLANENQQKIMTRWRAGKLKEFSPMARCFIAYDSLYWGAFGERLSNENEKEKKEILEHLENDIIICLQKDFETDDNERGLTLEQWLQDSSGLKDIEDYKKAVQFQGNYSLASPKDFKNVFSATQWTLLNQEEQKEYEKIPFHIQPIKRVVERMNEEIFMENK